MQDIQPGQAVIIERDKAPVFQLIQPQKSYSPDVSRLPAIESLSDT